MDEKQSGRLKKEICTIIIIIIIIIITWQVDESSG